MYQIEMKKEFWYLINQTDEEIYTNLIDQTDYKIRDKISDKIQESVEEQISFVINSHIGDYLRDEIYYRFYWQGHVLMYNVELLNELNSSTIWRELDDLKEYVAALYFRYRNYDNTVSFFVNIIYDLNKQLKDQHVSNWISKY